MVLTVDFFTPILDDPFDFGRVAATNSLSDVYAMGGRPVAALNIAGFPEKKLPAEVLASILRGGAAVARAAGTAIVGGHTVEDAEVKYGLAVVGLVRPDRVVTNAGARAGDALVLTKPIGTGVLSTALKAGALDETGLSVLVDVLTRLNREASEKMLARGVHACTDVTGFGLLGHAMNIARESGVCVEIEAHAVPLITGALAAVESGHLTGGAGKTRSFLGDAVEIADGVDPRVAELCVDPQTAGGLLVALPADHAQQYVDALGGKSSGVAVIGRCVEAGDGRLPIRLM